MYDTRVILKPGVKLSLCSYCVASMYNSLKTSNIGERFCCDLNVNKDVTRKIKHLGDKVRFCITDNAWKYDKYVKISNDDRRLFMEKVNSKLLKQEQEPEPEQEKE